MGNENVDEIKENKERREDILEFGVVQPQKPVHNIHCLNIIGQIEGHVLLPPTNKTTKYEHVLPLLTVAEEDSAVEGLLVTLNTVGGDVEAGLAIAEMISTMSKPTVSLVIGGGHSIGVPMAVASDFSFITQSATMTLHPIRMNGLIIGATQTYEYFEKVQQQVMEFIARNCRVPLSRLKNLMLATGHISNDIGTILFGTEAVREGLIDAVGGIGDAVAKLHELIEEKGNGKES